MTKQPTLGPVMLDIDGLKLSTYDIEKIKHPNTGAVILFARNYADPAQLTSLCTDIRNARQGAILIAVDQEGGRVQRFQSGFSRLPPAAHYRNHPELTESAGWLMAIELLAHGVDFSFAPVLDVDCGVSTVIGNRSFNENADLVASLASDFMRGMHKAGMAAVGKHFPGHGAVALDSHLALPTDQRSLDELIQKDLIPFTRLINEGIEGIMPAHIVYSTIDNDPASFSRFWLQDHLRQRLKFNGAIFSDDLSMGGAAIAGSYPERAQRAQEAGCDMLLVCNNPSAADAVLDALQITENPLRDQRLLAMRGKFSTTRDTLLASSEWQQISQQISHIML